MAVWLVRAGRRGEQEQIALDNGVVAIGWNELADLSGIEDKEAWAKLYRETHPSDPPTLISNQVGQVWAFRHRMQEGDLAVVPLKTQSAIAIGKVSGPYAYRTDLGEAVHHTALSRKTLMLT